MLFGQSVFQSVVQRLEREAAEAAPAEAPGTGFKTAGLSSPFLFETVQHDGPAANLPLDVYLGFLEEQPEPALPEPEVMPAHLHRTALSDVSAELAISDHDTAESLAEKRRAFARLNHPDMVSPQFRSHANLRMTAANLLIDQALRLLAK